MAGQYKSYQAEMKSSKTSTQLIGCVALQKPFALKSLTLQTEVLRGKRWFFFSQQPSAWKVLISCFSGGPTEPGGVELLMERSSDG